MLRLFVIFFVLFTYVLFGQNIFWVDAENGNCENSGSSPEDAWSGFDCFDINTEIPDNSIIYVVPGVYTTGHENYAAANAMIWIKHRSNIKILKYGMGEVIFDGEFGGYEIGIYGWMQGSSNFVSDVEIEGITFRNYLKHAIKMRGYPTSPNYLTDVSIHDCIFDGIKGLYHKNCAAISLQIVNTVNVIHCEIESVNPVEIDSETDGIYIDDSKNITIEDNYIFLVNNSEDDLVHVDCIQATKSDEYKYGCENIFVNRNTLYNRGAFTTNEHRQGIYILNTRGDIMVGNNLVVSKKGDGLIHIYIEDRTDQIRVLNNTLVGEGNQNQLMEFNKAGDLLSNLTIKNNILYKNEKSTTNDLDAIKFTNIEDNEIKSSVNYDVLNNNLYYNNSAGTGDIVQLRFYKFGQHNYTRPWNYTVSNEKWWESNGISENPRFEDLSQDNYNLKYFSPAKNRGEGLVNYKITTDITGYLRPYWNKDFDIGAFEIEDTQLKVGVEGGASNTERTFSLTAIGTYWEKQDVNWNISTDQSLQSVDYIQTGFNTDLDTTTWFGFEYKWLLHQQGQLQHPKISSGFYKLSVFEEIDEQVVEVNHFYLDLRDAVTSYSPNIYIKILIVGQNRYLQFLTINKTWQTINDGDILRIWDIRNGQPRTYILSEYWENCLIPLARNNHPFIVWGPYTSPIPIEQQNYEVSRKLSSLDWAVFTTTNRLTFHYEDKSYNVGNSFPAYYKVRAVEGEAPDYSEYTNIVTVNVEGIIPDKHNTGIQVFDFVLQQNYPNPFNPLTVISFTLPEKQYVKLKLYDITGREVKILVDSEYDAGLYNVEFNGSELSSGVYFYRIIAGNYIDTKKLQILK
jgi:hypothetical protein